MNNLYITGTESYLKVQDQHFLVFNCHGLQYKVPVEQVNNLVFFGYCKQSDKAVKYALYHHISVLFLGDKGTYCGRIEIEEQCKAKYLAHQRKCAKDPELTRAIAESIVRAKLHNSCILLRRFFHSNETKPIPTALKAMALLMDDLPLANSVDVLRGYVQTATTVYFQALGRLFTEAISKNTKRLEIAATPMKSTCADLIGSKSAGSPAGSRPTSVYVGVAPNFQSVGKLPQHPPTDPINSLLNLGYILLNQMIYSLLPAAGLHSHIGNLHIHRDHHPALVADFMEEFSALFVDSLVMNLLMLQLFTPEDFTPPDEQGGVYLYPDAIHKFLTYWEKTLHSEVTHLYAGTMNYQQCLQWQVREYVACLLGNQEYYRPMLWKV